MLNKYIRLNINTSVLKMWDCNFNVCAISFYYIENSGKCCQFHLICVHPNRPGISIHFFIEKRYNICSLSRYIWLFWQNTHISYLLCTFLWRMGCAHCMITPQYRRQNVSITICWEMKHMVGIFNVECNAKVLTEELKMY